MTSDSEQLRSQLAASESEIATLRAALEFYRDNWLVTSDGGEPFEPNDELWEDKGARARAELNKEKSSG